VLLITVDTLRADAIGAYGNARATTPWIDRLAAAGVRFDSAHAHNVVTLPSHANILSGLYPTDHGVRDNAGFRFPDNVPTLATLLKDRGYATAAFVSAFPLASRFGLARGFDVYDDSFVDATPRTPLLEQERAGTETVALARRWLDAHASGPTLVWVHLFEPHAPYDVYARDVTAADAALEPLIAPLLSASSNRPTLIVFTADHGESLGEHGEETHGVFAYEATLRVPLIIVAPGIAAGRVDRSPARHVDIVPTILDAIGAPPDAKLPGRDLFGSPPATTTSYFESLSPALNRGWAPPVGMTRGSMKFIDLPIAELYDLASDPREQQNLASTRDAEVRAFRNALRAFGDRRSAATRPRESVENNDSAARLRSLGYVTGSTALRQKYTEADDPKRLMGLDARLQEAVRLHASGERARALEIARGITTERPDMRVGWMTLAQIQRDSRDLDAAIASMRRAHALAPGDAQTTSLLAAYLTERGRATDAIALLTPAASDDRADVQVLVTLGLAQAQAGRGAEAIATIERARRADPSNHRLLIELGTVQLVANRREEARKTFELAVARNPTLARAHSSLAAIHVEDGRTAEAIASWREATRLDPSEYGRIFLLGISQARAHKTAAARTCLAFFADNAPSSHYAREIAAARAWLAR
jgi:Flp pilus assembly protein TadD